MATVTNKTSKPVTIPLIAGKTLHLGPGVTGQISPKAAQNPKLMALAEAGEIEIVGADSKRNKTSGGGKKERSAAQAHANAGAIRRSGDR
ncbi:MAG: hypothetical protein ACI8TX_000727 [Hyphomicrobiaceae bacterium]|jgi:hypothetical protein